jgi:carbonic anhydrase
MSGVETLMVRNRAFAEKFEGADLKIPPRLSIILLTCVDSRVDPAHLFGLDLGDVLVLRNTGGRVTPGVLLDLAVLSVLGANMPGPAPMRPELVIMHHTDCGMARLANPPVQQQLAERLGLSDDEVAAMAVTDPAASIHADIERLRQAPGTPDALVVSGLVYDVRTGRVDQAVPPAPLRATT